MRVILDVRARQDLQAIKAWIAADSLRAANAVTDRILDQIELLEIFPFMGREIVSEPFRELVIAGLPYIVVYEVDTERDRVKVKSIFHTARDRNRD